MDILINVFNFCMNVMNYQFHFGNYTFTLWNVFTLTIVLSVVGYVLHEIIFIYKGD